MAKIALITGGNRGLGYATANRLGQSGVTVIIGSRSIEAGKTAAAELRTNGVDASSVQLDVTNIASIRAAVDQVKADHGVLDILVNNAGIVAESPGSEDISIEGAMFEKTFATNVTGVASVTEQFLPMLSEAASGRVVNVSSGMGSLGDQSDASSPWYGMVVPAYQASKAALNSLTIGLSKLLSDTPVKVNAVCPGFVQTELTPMNRDAPLTAVEASQVVADTALDTSPDGPSGQFFNSEGPIAW